MAKLNHEISLAAAAALTQRARDNKLLPILAWSFDRGIFDALLMQMGSNGVRIYLGQKEDGSPTPVVVAVDDAGNDLVDGVLAEESDPCPPFCSAGNALNK